MPRTGRGSRRNPHHEATGSRRRRLHLQFERLEPRALLAASPFAHYDIGTPVVTDLWVDPAAGNDGNSGATRDQALRTLTEAWNRIPSGAALGTSGYRIQLAPGRYSEDAMPTWWDDRHGTFEHPIILQAADGPGTVTLAGMDVHDVHYMYLIGLRLEVRGGGGDVVHFASCDHMLIRDCELAGLGDIAAYDSPQESLKANQSQYLYVEDSDISGAYWTAVDYVAVQYGHVIGSKIHRAGDWAMYFKGGSAYLNVEGNEIYDANTGGFSAGQGTGFEYMVAPWLHYESYDVKFVNNVIHDTVGAGIGVNGSYNVLMADNAINTLQPELVDPAHGDFRPVAGGNVFSATIYTPPDFAWTGLPSRPAVPAGTLSNAVPDDRAGNPRSASSIPGAYAGEGMPQSVFFLHQSVGEGIMADHNGHPGLTAQIEAAGHSFADYNLWNSPPGGSIPTEIASLFADANGDGQYGDVLDTISGAGTSDVLMLKSCFYTLAELENPANLTNWEQAFINSVAPYANQHPGQKLVLMPAVPERRSSGLSAAAAGRGRLWSDWLAGDFISHYATQHNVYSFNLFDFLADPASNPTNGNYQRAGYRNSDPGDSHPNDTAYSAAADAIAQYLLTSVIPGETNRAPVAAGQSVETPQGAAIAVTLAATDSDGDSLTYDIVDRPASGTVDLAGNAATYTPSDGWHGNDHFTFRAYDGRAYSNTATVGITVYDPDPVVLMPAGPANGNALVRRRSGHLQVVNQRNGRLLFDQPMARLHSLTVVGADNRPDRLTIDWPAGAGPVLPGLVFRGGTGGQGDTLVLRGTAGRDTFAVTSDSAAINGLTVRFSDIEQLALNGGAGNDSYRISGLSTRTAVVDSAGIDLLDFSGAMVGVTIDLSRSAGRAQRIFGPATMWTVALYGTIENVIGTPQTDLIRGNAAANNFWGGDGNDTIYGGGGNDTLYGESGDDCLYGEAGNDVLDAGPGNNVLVGGSGSDRLDASESSGRNLLIGGSGFDTLRGGSGEDILIAGPTSYDARPAALAAVMREWVSASSFQERRTNLDNGIFDATVGFVQLRRRTNAYRRGTVHDDGVRDTLYGDPAGDWIFSFARDTTG